MDTYKLAKICRNAIIAYESELDSQGYDSDDELHHVVLNEFGIEECDYKWIMYCGE